MMYTDLNTEQFKEKMQEPDTVILDVRTAAEYNISQIPGALTGYDFYNGEFEEKYLSLDPSKTYLIYCRSGVRSAHACMMMHAEGFKKLYNLRGGILAWNHREK